MSKIQDGNTDYQLKFRWLFLQVQQFYTTAVLEKITMTTRKQIIDKKK